MPSSPIPNKGEKARASIKQAARLLFYHKGYGATSYADIAEKSGYAKGNIHYYFNSKDDVLRAVTSLRLKDYSEVLLHWESECKTAEACLGKFIEMFTNSADNLALYGCPMGTLNSELGKTSSNLQEDTRPMFDVFLLWLEKQFSRLMPAKKAKINAEHLMVLAQGISALAHAYRDEKMVERQAVLAHKWLNRVCRKAKKRN